MKLIESFMPEILGVIFGVIALAFGFLVFSLVFSLIDYLGNIENMNALSISAVVAIILFVVKEVLEILRKKKARKRKISALRSILSEEIKINYWTWLKIYGLVKTVKEMPPETQYQIISSTSGTERFIFIRPDGGGGGQGFPGVQNNVLTGLISEIAEVDERFYSLTIAYSKGVAELKHLRDGAYDFVHETQQGEHYTEGFCEYALDELPEIKDSFRDLFKECTGEDELHHRMR